MSYAKCSSITNPDEQPLRSTTKFSRQPQSNFIPGPRSILHDTLQPSQQSSLASHDQTMNPGHLLYYMIPFYPPSSHLSRNHSITSPGSPCTPWGMKPAPPLSLYTIDTFNMADKGFIACKMDGRGSPRVKVG